MIPSSAALAPDGTFSGYASLFGVEDQGRDVVMPGAFRASIAQRGARQIRMLFQHDPAQPIGAWDDIREDARGLFVRGRIIAEAARGADLLALLNGGALDGLSIGFRARRAQRDAANGLRRLYDIDLWEISVVTFPMLPGARIFAMKSATAATFVGHVPTASVAVSPARPRLAACPSSPRLPGRQTRSAAPPSPGAARARPGGGFLSGCGMLRPVGGAVGD